MDITQEEIDRELEENPIYCPACGACGEDSCCKPTMCIKINGEEVSNCLYFDAYVTDIKLTRDYYNGTEEEMVYDRDAGR